MTSRIRSLIDCFLLASSHIDRRIYWDQDPTVWLMLSRELLTRMPGPSIHLWHWTSLPRCKCPGDIDYRFCSTFTRQVTLETHQALLLERIGKVFRRLSGVNAHENTIEFIRHQLAAVYHNLIESTGGSHGPPLDFTFEIYKVRSTVSPLFLSELLLFDRI